MTEPQIRAIFEIALSLDLSIDNDNPIESLIQLTHQHLGCHAVTYLKTTTSESKLIATSSPLDFLSSHAFLQFEERYPLIQLIQEVCANKNSKTVTVDKLSYLVMPFNNNAVLIAVSNSVVWGAEFISGFQRLLDQFGKISGSLGTARNMIALNQRLKLATKAGAIGTWELETVSGALKWDEQMYKIFEITHHEFSGNYDFFKRCLHPEDAGQLIAIVDNYAENALDEPIDYQFRIVTPSGVIKKISGHATISDTGGTEKKLVGVNYDITELETARTQSIYRSQLESLIIELSLRVIRSGPDDLDTVTKDALELVGKFIKTDRAYRFTYDFIQDTTCNTHEWCAEGITPEIANLQCVPVEAIQVWVNAHKKGLPMVVTRVGDLPAGHALREILEPQGVLSLVTIPLMHDLECIGFIGFDAVKQERHWNDVDISLLKLLADLLVNAEMKNRNERAIQEAHAALLASRDTARYLAQEAAAASEAKSRFMARISHEIRTPLHAILGHADLASDIQNQEELTDRIETIKASGTTLLELINDILSFSQAESNEMSLKLSSFSVRELMRDVLKMFEPIATQQKITISTVVDELIPEKLIGDQLRIRQILNNLISNAIKFTPLGGVTIKITNLSAPTSRLNHGDHLKIIFEIIDTGIGIQAEKLDSIFDPFYQADDSYSRRYLGTGLGLTISKLLAEKMGGRISVESSRHQGSTFKLELSLAEALVSSNPNKINVDTNDAHRLWGIRVLLAEDNPVNQKLVQAFLKDTGCELDVADDGNQALKLYSDNTYDVILMDCQMPELDGYDATRIIRHLESQDRHIPIIAVTASALKDDSDKCLQTGMDDVLTKPFSKGILLRMLQKWIPERTR